MRAISTSLRLVAAGIMCAATLSGCDSARDALGITKQSPDEFAVITRAPLSVPPDYGLRPPQPGAPRPQEAETKDSARGLLVNGGGGRQVASAQAGPAISQGESALLAKADATNVDPSIRREIDRESSILAAENKSFVDSLIFWREPEPPGTVLDAEQESRRLRENAALGKAPTEGRTPRIERKPKGWLVGLFN